MTKLIAWLVSLINSCLVLGRHKGPAATKSLKHWTRREEASLLFSGTCLWALSIYEKNPEFSVVAKVEFPIGKTLFHLVVNPGT